MCLYIGDIGDNSKNREYISVYRVQEPKVLDTLLSTTNWNVFHFKYTDGKKHNAESMLIDAVSRELIIVTKSMLPPFAKVFVSELDVSANTFNTLQYTGISLNLPYATDATSSQGKVVNDFSSVMKYSTPNLNNIRVLVNFRITTRPQYWQFWPFSLRD